MNFSSILRRIINSYTTICDLSQSRHVKLIGKPSVTKVSTDRPRNMRQLEWDLKIMKNNEFPYQRAKDGSKLEDGLQKKKDYYQLQIWEIADK